MWYLYTVEFFSAMKKNEILSSQINGWNFSEVSRAQKAKNQPNKNRLKNRFCLEARVV
jgi:hypothetical protein